VDPERPRRAQSGCASLPPSLTTQVDCSGSGADHAGPLAPLSEQRDGHSRAWRSGAAVDDALGAVEDQSKPRFVP
jgi:hypothetical protein